MKRITKALAVLMLTTAMLCTVGCKKETTINGNNDEVATDTVCFTVSVSAQPSNGGMVSGSGSYKPGQSCTVTASAANGFTFSCWTEHGSKVSTDANYSFTVDGNHSLVANFTEDSPTVFSVGVSAFPANFGMVSGGGNYQRGQSCTLTATPNNGFVFVSWVEGNNEVSTDANYTFTVSHDRNLTANFAYEFQGPTGAIKGKFSINADGDMVYFSQGNLQYQAITDTWRFAEHQWDYVGGTYLFQHYGNVDNCSNNDVSPNYSGWIDLFGWGTSGWDCGNTYYHPWDVEGEINIVDDEIISDGRLYGPPGYYDLTGEYANSDWGRYNTISNGDGEWRTLSRNEWVYVFTGRRTSSGIRYAKAEIRCENALSIYGFILLPDDWSESYYMLNDPNNGSASYSNNVIDYTEWSILEAHGAVFLPPTGSRSNYIYLNGDYGNYWSASCGIDNSSDAYFVLFTESGFAPVATDRMIGRAVRLVSPVGN